MNIANKVKDKGGNLASQLFKEDEQTESYLKIADLYYKMKLYDQTIETLKKIKEKNELTGETINSKHQIQAYYRYAQTYEMLDDSDQAVKYLQMIERKGQEVVTQAADDTILAKSNLHLGR